MKMKSLSALLGIALAIVAIPANATPILITQLDLNAFPPFGDAEVGAEINSAIAAYNLVNNPDLPTAGIGATPNVKVNTNDSAPSPFPTFGSDTLSIIIPSGFYNYIFLHWGGNGADASDTLYKNPELYYIGAETGPLTFTAPLDWNVAPNKKGEIIPKQYGLSFYSLYSPIDQPAVPDGGATVALLGVGLTALEGLRRRFKKA